MDSWSLDGGMWWNRDRQKRRKMKSDLSSTGDLMKSGTQLQIVYLSACWYFLNHFTFQLGYTWHKKCLLYCITCTGKGQNKHSRFLAVLQGCLCELSESESDCGHHAGAGACTIASPSYIQMQLSVWRLRVCCVCCVCLAPLQALWLCFGSPKKWMIKAWICQ